jgi:hypothetical protein
MGCGGHRVEGPSRPGSAPLRVPRRGAPVSLWEEALELTPGGNVTPTTPAKTSALLLALAAALLGGCGSPTLSLSARAGGAPAAGLARGALSVAGGATIDEVRLVIRRVRLDAGGGSDGGSGSSEVEVAAGPFLVDLAGALLDSGAVATVLDAEVKEGTYRRLRFDIHKLSGGEATGDARLAAMAGTSVVVTGTFHGAPFTFSSALDEEQEREGTFQVGSGSNNVTLSIDPSRWFVDGSGAGLDPSDPSNRSRIEASIKASIDAFDDDDRDGRR